MATYQVPPPTPMSLQGDVAEHWKGFELASRVTTQSLPSSLRDTLTKMALQILWGKLIHVAATLCTVMGTDDLILRALHLHFIPQRNVLFERFRFNAATQGTDSVDDYIIRLRQLVESCEFADLKDILIRDRLVIWTSDEICIDRLLREHPALTITDATLEKLPSAVNFAQGKRSWQNKRSVAKFRPAEKPHVKRFASKTGKCK